MNVRNRNLGVRCVNASKPSERATRNLKSIAVPEAFSVVVDCADEAQQREVYERLSAEGFKCRLLVI